MNKNKCFVHLVHLSVFVFIGMRTHDHVVPNPLLYQSAT